VAAGQDHRTLRLAERDSELNQMQRSVLLVKGGMRVSLLLLLREAGIERANGTALRFTDIVRDGKDPQLLQHLATLGPVKVARNRLTYRPVRNAFLLA